MSSCSKGRKRIKNELGVENILIKAVRSMEPVRRKECVGGCGRTKGFISRAAMMR